MKYVYKVFDIYIPTLATPSEELGKFLNDGVDVSPDWEFVQVLTFGQPFVRVLMKRRKFEK